MHKRISTIVRSRSVISLAISALLAAVPLPAFASEAHGFDISTTEASAAVRSFGRQSGVQIMAAGEVLDGRKLNAVSGEQSIESALQTLLADTGLTHEYVGERGVVLKPVNAPIRLAQAENNANRPDAGESLDEVIVRGTRQGRYDADTTHVGRMDQEVIKIPRSVNVIPEQVLIDQQIYDISDALKNVGGLTEGDGFGGTITDYYIRGFRRNEFHQNGMKVASGGANQPPTQNIETIEVIKGPASVLYGQLEPGGMINIRTKKPSFEQRGYVQAVFDDFGKRLGTVDVSGPLGSSDTLAFRFNGSYERSDTYRDFFEIKREFVSPSLLWKITDNTTATLTYEYFHDNRPMDRGMVALQRADGSFYIPNNIPVGRRYGERFDERDSEVRMTEATIEQRFSDTWTATASFLYSEEAAYDVYTDNRAVSPAGLLTRGVGGSNDRDLEVTIGSAWVNGQFATGGVDHKLAFGFDYRDGSESRYAARGPNVAGFNIFNPVYGLISDTRARPGTPFATDETAAGAFVQDQIFLTDRFIVLAGLRYDQTEGHSLVATTNTRINRKTAVTPQLGTLFQPTEDTSLYLSYSEGFVPVTSVDAETGETYDPQESRQYEIGAKARVLQQRLTISTAIYDLEKTNILDRDPATGSLKLLGVVRSRGFEADVTGQVLPGLNVLGSYAYTDNEVLTPGPARGKRTSNIADHTLRLWTSYEIREGRMAGFGTGLGVNYTSDRFGNTDNTLRLGSYTLVDLGTWYYLDAASFGMGAGKQVRLGLNVKNLLDKRYYPGAGDEVRINVGRPRTVIASVGFVF